VTRRGATAGEAPVFFCRPATEPDETNAAVTGLRALCQAIESPFVLVDEVIFQGEPSRFPSLVTSTPARFARCGE